MRNWPDIKILKEQMRVKAYLCQEVWKAGEMLKWELVQLWIPAEEALSETAYSSCCLPFWRTLLTQTKYINHNKNHTHTLWLPV